MQATLLFATRNPHKRELFAPIFAAHGIRCLTLRDVGLESLEIHESGVTPLENALLKARALHSKEWPLVFGDDAGLEIDALDGEPGLQARRWNGRFDDDVDDETWLAYLLQRLNGIPLPQRTARYIAAWVVIVPGGKEYVRHFCRQFTIAERPLRPLRPGSPMSSVEIQYDGDTDRVRAHIAQEWEQWGILQEITGRGPGRSAHRRRANAHPEPNHP